MTISAHQFFEDLQTPEDFKAYEETQKRVTETLPVLSAGQLLAREVPPREDILGEALLFSHGLTALIAPPGTGKTRLCVQIPICSLCGFDLGPLTVPRRNLKWLLLAGNENSLLRYKTDLERMLPFVPDGMRAKVLDSLFFHVTEGIDDIISADSMDRVRETVGEIEPDVVILDPLGDIIRGDANADTDLRASVHAFTRAIWAPRPDAAVLLVHHAREGSQNVRQAIGWDRGNFGKGSKALIAACRAVINMAPKSQEGCGGIVLAAGKVNDAKPFETFAMDFHDGWYVEDPDFDVEAWLADVDGKRGTVHSCTIQDMINFLESQPGKMATQRQIAEHYEVSLATVNKRYKTGVKQGYFRKSGKGVKSTGKMEANIDVEHFEEEL